MKRILLFALLTLFAFPALGGTKACTTAMVTAGICRVEANVVLYFDAPVAFWLSMADEICTAQDYQALIDGELNPMTCGEFSQAWLRRVFLNLEKSGRARAAAQAASDVVQAEPDADVGDGS
jgi:hypothetical protein